MARRFETHYRTGHLENIGDPDWHDRRWEDLDRRMHARDLGAELLDVVSDRIEKVTLTRLEKISETIRQVYLLSDNIGLAFKAFSLTDRPFEHGIHVFTLTPETRDAFVVTDFVAIRPVGERNLIDGMLARTMHYEPLTGELTVNVVTIKGTGRCANWDIHVGRPIDQAHVQRTDNPHNLTIAQLDLWTRSEVDAVAVDHANTQASVALGSPPANLNTLGKLSAALGDDSSYAENLTTALNNRLLYTGPVVYSSAQKATGVANIDAVSPSYVEGLAKFEPQGRLCLASNTPFQKTTLTNATSIWYAPDTGKNWPMWNAALNTFVMRDFSGTGFAISQAMQDATLSPAPAQSYAVYDVFGWMSGSTPRISRGPVWRYSCPYTMSDGHTVTLTLVPGQSHPLRYGEVVTISGGNSAFWRYYAASMGGQVFAFVTQVGNPNDPVIQVSESFNFPPTPAGYPPTDDGTLTCYSCLRNSGPGSSELEYLSAQYPQLAVNKYSILNGPPARGGLFLGTIATNATATVDWDFGGVGTACKFMLANAHRKREVVTRITCGGAGATWTSASSTVPRRIGNKPELEANFVTCDSGELVNASSSTIMQPSASWAEYSQWMCLDGLFIPNAAPHYRSTVGGGATPGAAHPLENVLSVAVPAPGRHRLNMLEMTASTSSVTVHGDYTHIYYSGQH